MSARELPLRSRGARSVGGRWPTTTCSPPASATGSRPRGPLADRMRPRTLDEIVGQRHLLGAGRGAAGPDRGRPAVVGDPLGPAGDGQDHAGPADRRAPRPRPSSRSSAVTAGVKDVREVIDGRPPAPRRAGGQGTILFLDEVHRFNKAQQDALLPAVEEGMHHPDRGHHREPLLRGQRPPPQPLDALPPRAARRRTTSRPARPGARARGPRGRRRRGRAASPTGPAATPAPR